MKREGGSENVLGGLGVSVMVHVAIIAAVVIGTITGSEAIEQKVEEEQIAFEPVELIRLGEPKPKHQLPRIANPAPKTVKEKVVNLAKKNKPDTKPVPKKKDPPPKEAKRVRDKRPSAADILNNLHNPNRPTNEDKVHGSKHGVEGGTSLDESAKHMMNTYAAKVQRAVRRKWRVPTTISKDRAKELAGKVRVSIRLSESGSILSYRFQRRSGDAQFDGSIEAAVKQFTSAGGHKFPLPDREDVKRAVISKGLRLNNWKASF